MDIDLLTDLDAVSFEEAWRMREIALRESLPVALLSKKPLIVNKLAVGRSQDVADVARLRELSESARTKGDR